MNCRLKSPVESKLSDSAVQVQAHVIGTRLVLAPPSPIGPHVALISPDSGIARRWADSCRVARDNPAIAADETREKPRRPAGT